LKNEFDLDEIELRIFDLLGKEQFKASLNYSTNKIDTKNIKSGVYIYQILKNTTVIHSGRLIAV
jgi:hypothetical protein